MSPNTDKKIILPNTDIIFKILGKKQTLTYYNTCVSENFYLKIPCKSQPFLLHLTLLFDLKINFNVDIKT